MTERIPVLYLAPWVGYGGSDKNTIDWFRWIDRERKLRSIILTPAMVLVWVFGITLATVGHLWTEGWLHAKLAFVIGLTAYHGYMIGYGRKLARGDRPVSGKALRLMNEVPGVAAAAIVVLVIIKPF